MDIRLKHNAQRGKTRLENSFVQQYTFRFWAWRTTFLWGAYCRLRAVMVRSGTVKIAASSRVTDLLSGAQYVVRIESFGLEIES